jgi:Cof subfamily protein (haloacid dehalogenase superfamily)
VVLDVKLLAIDADGTLVDPADHIRPRVREAVRAVAARGIPIVLATGRSLDGADLVLEELGIDLGLALVNGAICTEGRHTPSFRHAMLPTEVGFEALDALQAAGCAPFIYDDPEHEDVIVMEAAHPRMPGFIAARTADHRHVDLRAWYDHPVLTILAAGEREPMQRVSAELGARLSGRAEVICSYYQTNDLWLLTIVAAGCNKADAVEAFARRRGFGMEHVMAIGDSNNDVDLVRRAGFGVAMGNAVDEVKAVADAIVADNSHDGVAEAIERWVLDHAQG